MSLLCRQAHKGCLPILAPTANSFSGTVVESRGCSLRPPCVSLSLCDDV